MNTNHTIKRFRLYRLIQVMVISTVALLSACVFIQGQASAKGLNHISLFQKVYHVYVDGEKIGTVDDQQVIQSYLDQKLKAINKKKPDLQYVIAEDITYESVQTFRPDVNAQATLAALKDMLTIKAQAVAITVNGKKIGYVEDKDTALSVLQQFKANYVPKDVLEKLAKHSEKQAKDKSSQTAYQGVMVAEDTKIVDVTLSAEVAFKKTAVTPDKISNETAMLQALSANKQQTKTYTVQKGDVLSEIAAKFDATKEALKALNTGLQADDVLHIGQQIKVKTAVPLLSVIVKKTMTDKENIAYETKVKKDDDMYKGHTKVVQQGSDGQKEIQFLLKAKMVLSFIKKK